LYYLFFVKKQEEKKSTMKRLICLAPLVILVLVNIVCVENAILTLNLFSKNDYRTCPMGAPNRTIALTDDGNCYELVAAQPELNFEACYYATYSDIFIGTKSAETYAFRALAILERCDCEYITARTGMRHYNRSCFIARLYNQCESFKHNKKSKYFWNRLYDDSTLEYWGVDVDYLQDYMLY
ncbi:MAG: hypothetical protein ACTSUE_05670, partial [Promethearchaeota archaeon]